MFPLENQNKNALRKYLLLSLATVFVLFFTYSLTLDSSYAYMEDGILSKYTSNGQYKIEMKWSPSGELKPDTDYFLIFQIKDALTDTILDNNSFNLEITQNNKSLNNYSKELDSSIFAKKFLFTDSGIVNFVLSDINNSDQNVKFSMKLDSEFSSLVNDRGFTSKKKTDGKPVIFACGFEKNAITLQKCYKTQTYDNYGWFGKVNFIIYAPGWNQESDQTEYIGNTQADAITITSRSDHTFSKLGICDGFVETGPDTGLFVGRVKLSGYDYDVDGDGTLEKKFGKTKCSNSPIDEYAKIEAGRSGAVTLSWQYQDDPVKVVTRTINYHWNLGQLDFVQDRYNLNDTVEFTFYDRDMYKVPEKEFNLSFRVYSDSDQAGIIVPVGENYKFKKPFNFLVNSEKTVAESLYVQNGDTVYVEYTDCTLPVGNNVFGISDSTNDCRDVIASTVVYGY